MEKIAGKDMELWFDGKEVPVTSATLNTAYDTSDGTDTATPGDGKDTELGRATRSMTVEAYLYEPDGAEVATGTLVERTRYRVTAGTITEGTNVYEVGMIFESDGTGTASAINKVVPLGARVNGKDIGMTFNGAEVAITDLNFNLAYDELDGTDSATVGDSKETEVSRAERDTAITGFVRDTLVDLLTESPQVQACVLDFSATTSVEGVAIPISKNIVDGVNDLVKVDYSFKWAGRPTETNMGLVAGVSKAIKLILKRGTATNKEYVGTAIVTKKAAKSSIKDLATVSYTININGALTENVRS